eukprot:Hpha_TRINITY_DN14971_c1_g1::TRINITY_DN14971_c1_g1_i1::g.143899::m.143899
MSERNTSAPRNVPQKDPTPPWWGLVLFYTPLAWGFLHFYGRSFASVKDVAREFALPLLAIGGFVMSYELFDSMGVAKAAFANANAFKDGKVAERFSTPVSDLPPSYMRAVRAQSNQVEQVPFFIAMLLGAVLFADGIAVGSLGVGYCSLRALYARAYRRGGLTDKLGAYTVPCYFIMGTISMVNVIGAIKVLLK